MNEIALPYQSPGDRFVASSPLAKQTLRLNEWNIQMMVKELVTNYVVQADAQERGYPFSYKNTFDVNGFYDNKQSEVFVDIGYQWNATAIQKRPAVIIQRSNSSYANQVMNQTVSYNVAESEKNKESLANMGIGVMVIADNLGLTEQFACYLKDLFLCFQEEIRRDFGLNMFKLMQVDPPQQYKEAKDHFMVMLNIMTAFNVRWVVKGDHLKLKSVSKLIFDNLTNKPLQNQ